MPPQTVLTSSSYKLLQERDGIRAGCATRTLLASGSLLSESVLSKQLRNHVAVADDHDRPAGIGVVLLGVVDAEGLVERCRHVSGGIAFILGHRGLVVAFAQDLASLDAAARHDHEH